MTKAEQEQWLVDQLKNTVTRAMLEFDFTYVEVIGALQFVQLNFFRDATERQKQDDHSD